MDKIIEFNSEFKPDWWLAQENLKKEEEKLNKIVKEILRWVSVKKGLPEEEGSYLVTNASSGVCIGYFTNNLSNYVDGRDYNKYLNVPGFANTSCSEWYAMNDVIAWMPLPEPYIEED